MKLPSGPQRRPDLQPSAQAALGRSKFIGRGIPDHDRLVASGQEKGFDEEPQPREKVACT